ncbi:MAG: cupin domain-containing protein [Flavobacteriaceae bacterium]|nr:cupin domain-containing protein [Flavobacteriaceae bacterium]
MNSKETIIKQLDLAPHPEGGYFKETYRSEGFISEAELGGIYDGNRNFATSIYFLLHSETFSAFHKIHQDEQWHFYMGSAIKLHVIAPNGDYWFKNIGNRLSEGEVPQYMVSGGHWFAAEVPAKNSYALAGCTVAPGFDFKDFDMPKRTELTKLFPQHTNIIERLTRD